MKWDDLLNIPYKAGGRDKNGLDCYGVVLECCRRAGTPLKDPLKECRSMLPKDLNDYIGRDINVKPIDSPKPGCIVEMDFHGEAHAGYLADANIVLHATRSGVRTTALGALKVIGYYEVVNESDCL